MNAIPRLDPTARHRTRLHIINEVWDFERDDWTPLPVEVAMLNYAVLQRRRLEDLDEAEIVAVQTQFCEDGTIVFRIVPVVSKEEAQKALRQAGYGERGLA